jgi:DNA-binding transcriptional ArsR family regulator
VSLPRPLADPLVELLAERFGAFAQPLRIRLIERLDEVGEATVRELAQAVGAGQQNVSKHLALLRRAGIVARRKDGSFVRYRLADPDAVALLEQSTLAVARHVRRQSRLIGPRPSS